MKKKSSIRQEHIFTDLRDLEKHILKIQQQKEKEDSLFYIHRIPELPLWTNKVYSSQGYKQNVHALKCSCKDFKRHSKKFSKRDIRIVCKHLYWKLTTTKIKNELDTLTKLLLDTFHKNDGIKLFKTSVKDEILILGFSNSTDWINVFIGKEKWKRYGFNIDEKRWAFNEIPEDAKLIETKTASLMNYIFNWES